MKYLNYEYKNDILFDDGGKKISEEECFNGIPQCRITGPEMFLDKVSRDIKLFYHKYSSQLIGNQEICFQHVGSRFLRYKNKKLLIVGGGPTTNQCQWENLDYDYIWSVNHFYKHPKLQKLPVDLCLVGQEVMHDHPKAFVDYVRSNETLVGFELCGMLYNKRNKFNIEDGITYDHRTRIMNYDFDNHFALFTRYYGWIGANWRQMILALFLGFKEIYFVGMDGYSWKNPVHEIPHSFEPGKVPKGGPMKLGAHEAFKQHLIIFWNYVLNRLKPDVRFYNLGEFTDENMTSYISKKHFPLTEKIKETIGVKY